MKMLKENKLVLGLALLAGVLTACEDDFSEEDALDAQRSTDLSVYVIDGADDRGVEDASVSLVKDGSEKDKQTNESGIATFKDVKIGSNIPLSVEKEGYTSVQRRVNITGNTNFRQGRYTVEVPVLSVDSASATIQGNVSIQTDLTNDSTEVPPEGTEVKALVDLENIGGAELQETELTTTTNADGEFEFTVPSNSSEGVDVDFSFPTLELDQTIAKNGNVGEPGLPENEPSIVSITTVFNDSQNPVDIPDVPAAYGIAPEPSEPTGERGYIGDVFVNSEGEVTDVEVEGTGSGYTRDEVRINIESPVEGAGGATVEVDVNRGSLSLADPEIITSGSGYPTRPSLNQAFVQAPDFPTPITNVLAGEVYEINANYGTGVYRKVETDIR